MSSERMSMNEKQEAPAQFVEMKAVPEYYSDALRVTSNIYATSIVFGRRRPVGLEGAAATPEEVCVVYMSPAHAKSLLLILRKQARDYEEKWGKLPVPPDMADQFGEDA